MKLRHEDPARRPGMEHPVMELNWTERRVSPHGEVIALTRPKSTEPWALCRSRRLFGERTRVLRRHAGDWDLAFEVKGRLDSIGALGDGSVLAVGRSRSMIFDDRCTTIESGPRGCLRVWGAQPGCANALTDEGLFHFDGRHWHRVELKAAGIHGRWADGDCDSRGRGWIVGMHGTHSCMASGSGANWQEDGCGSWYLYLVHVPDGGSAFAAGGDGTWRRDAGAWVKVDRGRDVSRFPLALSAAGPTPIVVAVGLRGIRESVARGKSSSSSTLEIWAGSDWQAVPAPVDHERLGASILAVDREARLFLAQGGSVWESSPVRRP